MANPAHDNIIAIADAYREATGKSWNQISKEFYGNSDFFDKLRSDKRSISVSQFFIMLGKFRAAWPPRGLWPKTRKINMGRYPKE